MHDVVINLQVIIILIDDTIVDTVNFIIIQVVFSANKDRTFFVSFIIYLLLFGMHQ